MSQNILQVPSPTIMPARRAAWAAEICALQQKIETAVQSALTHALDAGDILLKAKADAGHKGWASFLEAGRIKDRTAQVYMQLAKARSVIEAADPQSSADLSIAGALRLITKPRSKSPSKADAPDEGTKDPSPATTLSVDAVIAWLATASPEDRARVVEALSITCADVPPSVAADIVQHAVAQERELARKQRDALMKCVASVAAATRTQAAPRLQIDDVKEAIRRLERTEDALDRRRFAAESFIKKPLPAPDQETLLKSVERGPAGAEDPSVATGTAGPMTRPDNDADFPELPACLRRVVH